MAYDETLAGRIRPIMAKLTIYVEKKMFGGVAFMVQGNMACGVSKDMLMVRISPMEHDKVLREPFIRPFDMTGKPMRGWIVVEPDGIASDGDLRRWVHCGVDYALTLPPK